MFFLPKNGMGWQGLTSIVTIKTHVILCYKLLDIFLIGEYDIRIFMFYIIYYVFKVLVKVKCIVFVDSTRNNSVSTRVKNGPYQPLVGHWSHRHSYSQAELLQDSDWQALSQALFHDNHNATSWLF